MKYHRVVVVGSAGVGKSSLVDHFLSPDYVYTYESNRWLSLSTSRIKLKVCQGIGSGTQRLHYARRSRNGTRFP